MTSGDDYLFRAAEFFAKAESETDLEIPRWLRKSGPCLSASGRAGHTQCADRCQLRTAATQAG